MRPCPSCGKSCDETHKFCPSCGFPISQVQHDSGDALVGKTLPGGYVVLEPIGTGGMGRVYRGEQSALGRTVAVKVVHQHLLGDENTAARFVTEARAASRLNHPNSVAVIDFGKTDDGQLYLVMEFLRGRDLAHILHTESPMPFRRTINVLRQVLAALAQAHDMGIIHRDLKPENVILEPGRGGVDFVKVVDFGLAKILEQNGGENLTRPGIVCGTPDYMAPEQGRGDAIDARTDLYAVGIILYACLTGRLPFEADAPTQVVLMHLTIPAPDPRVTSPDRRIPKELAEVCLKALEKDPGARYQDADGFSSALLAVQEAMDRAAKAKPASIECGACGTSNPKSQKFCGECGAKLGALGMAETMPPSLAAEAPPTPRPSMAPPANSGRMGETPLPLPLLHRADDLAWLEERRGEVRSALVGARIVGEDGAGKTRLVTEFLETARAAGDHVVEAGPDPFWASVGYWTLRSIIGSLAEIPPDGGNREWTGASAEARQGLEAIFRLDDDSTTLRAEDRRYAAAEALRWGIVRGAQIAGKHRVIIVVDDLHRVDGVSRLALADVVGEPPLSPVLLLATHSPGVDVGWGAQASARVLPGLPKHVAAGVLRSKSRSHSSDPGHRGLPPMYVEQLVRFSREGGTEPPRRLADIVSLRVERLDPAARRILQGLAVTGDDASEMRLARVLKVGIESLVEARQALVEAGMITSARGSSLSIAHPLLREIVAASTPAAVRRELHAAALATEGDELPLEARAQHAYQAQDTFEALLLLEQMADRATSRGDSEGAVLALRRALDLARREFFRGELDDPARAVLIFSRKLGEALVDAGAFTDADGVLREALDLAGPAGVERARVLGALALVAFRRTRPVEAESYLSEAVEVARRTGEQEVVASVEDLRDRMARSAPSLAPPL